MAEWITLPLFINTQVVRAKTLQDMLTDLETLKNPMSAVQYMPGPSLDEWTTTTTNTWLDIDATYWQLAFESYGGDVFISADFFNEHSDAGGVWYYRFKLDGVGLGNTLGQAFARDNTGREVVNFHALVENLGAGSHTLSAQWYNAVAGTLSVKKDACFSLWTYEFA